MTRIEKAQKFAKQKTKEILVSINRAEKNGETENFHYHFCCTVLLPLWKGRETSTDIEWFDHLDQPSNSHAQTHITLFVHTLRLVGLPQDCIDKIFDAVRPYFTPKELDALVQEINKTEKSDLQTCDINRQNMNIVSQSENFRPELIAATYARGYANREIIFHDIDETGNAIREYWMYREDVRQDVAAQVDVNDRYYGEVRLKEKAPY